MKRQNTKHVNKMSERLMKDKRVGRVEDLLLKKGEDAVQKRKLLQVQEKDAFAPKITQMARNLERSGDVFSRYAVGHPRLYLGSSKQTGSQQDADLRDDSAAQMIENPEVLEAIMRSEVHDHAAEDATDPRRHRAGNLSTGGQASSAKTTQRTAKSPNNGPGSKVQVAEFLERNRKWAARRQENAKNQRDLKQGQDFKECTFAPETHPYEAQRASGDKEPDSSTEYKMVFGGKTFDLSNDKDLKNLFQHSLDKSGKGSIFRKNYDKMNKIYSAVLK